MKSIVPAVLASFLLIPTAFAQSRSFDLTGNVVWLDPTGGGEFEDLEEPAELEIDADAGYGLAANIFFTDRISTEFAIARIEPETTITRRRAVGGQGGTLDIMPITAVVQFHFAPNGFLDPYIGAGAAYVIYDYSGDTSPDVVNNIDVDDDVGLALNAGLGIRLGNRFGITLDGKYVPIESNARAVIVGANEESQGRVDVSPIILSAGLSLRF